MKMDPLILRVKDMSMQKPQLVPALLLLVILPGILVYYAETKPCLIHDCYIETNGLQIPVPCTYIQEHQNKLTSLLSMLTGKFQMQGLNISMVETTTTLPVIVCNCPECPICQTCQECVVNTCATTTEPIITITTVRDRYSSTTTTTEATTTSSSTTTTLTSSKSSSTSSIASSSSSRSSSIISSKYTYTTTRDSALVSSSSEASSSSSSSSSTRRSSSSSSSSLIFNYSYSGVGYNPRYIPVGYKECQSSAQCCTYQTGCCGCTFGGYIDGIRCDLIQKYRESIDCTDLAQYCKPKARECDYTAGCIPKYTSTGGYVGNFCEIVGKG